MALVGDEVSRVGRIDGGGRANVHPTDKEEEDGAPNKPLVQRPLIDGRRFGGVLGVIEDVGQRNAGGRQVSVLGSAGEVKENGADTFPYASEEAAPRRGEVTDFGLLSDERGPAKLRVGAPASKEEKLGVGVGNAVLGGFEHSGGL